MRRSRLKLRRIAWPALALMALAAGGCASPLVSAVPTWPDTLPLWPASKAAAAVPETVAVVWNPAVLQQPGATPTRGLGGLVTFYGPDRSAPIRVEGELIIYVYNDAGGPAGKVAPDAKYVFPAERLAGHYGQSALGPSYSIWIPWDRAGGPRQELTLTACFQPVEGGLVMGMPTRVVLEGPTKAQRQPARTAAAGPPASPPQGAVDAAGPPSPPARPTPAEPPRQMSTTTLSMPRAVER